MILPQEIGGKEIASGLLNMTTTYIFQHNFVIADVPLIADLNKYIR